MERGVDVPEKEVEGKVKNKGLRAEQRVNKGERGGFKLGDY